MEIKNSLIKFFFIFFIGVTAYAQYAKEDWKDRDSWMRVSKLMELASIKQGDHVADLGCHEGYLTIHLSKQVGSKGKVFAVDIAAYRLQNLEAYLAEQEITNVQTILGDEDHPKLPMTRLNAVMVIDTYHEIEAYKTVLQHIRSSLRPNGRLLILEKLKEPHKGKTREEQASAHTLSLEYVKEELLEAGFVIQKEITDYGTWNHEEEKQMWVIVASNSAD